MRLPAVQLKVLIGRRVPKPAPPWLLTAVENVEVTHDVEKRSGFELILRVGRGRKDIADYRAFQDPTLQPQSRVVLVVVFGTWSQVLMDGIVTQRQFTTGSRPGEGHLTLQGNDMTVLMEAEEKTRGHPQQSAPRIVGTVLDEYRNLGMEPRISFPTHLESPSRDDWLPTQRSTDLTLIQSLAQRHGYVFFLEPGPAPGHVTAWWGPPFREGVRQKPLRVNLGPDSNAEISNFHYDALAPVQVEGRVWDANRKTGVAITAAPRGDLSAQVKTRKLAPGGLKREEAVAQAGGKVLAADAQRLRVTGTLDPGRYLGLLRTHAYVEVQGAGRLHDGRYEVRRVTHEIRPGSYRQSFTLARPAREVL
ncbi:MAG TPA: hypothetical protein ENI90_09465 [Methylothermaceae bacterium]|nr:hypothetical protein [Methylothermaceae bacterium]